MIVGQLHLLHLLYGEWRDATWKCAVVVAVTHFVVVVAVTHFVVVVVVVVVAVVVVGRLFLHAIPKS